MKLRLLAGVVAVLVVSVVPAGASSGAADPPYQITSASLTQDGQQLTWRVELDHPFSAAGLAGGHRSLCLLIERVASRVIWGEVCVIRPTHGSEVARLVYSSVTGGKAGPSRVIDATVSRSGSSTLAASVLPSAVDLTYGPIRWQTASTVRSKTCASGTCSELYPATPTLLKLHTPVLVGCVASGRSLVYQGSSSRREIALTFDDGPWNDPPTSQFLDVLEREHVPATFFEIGQEISTYDPRGTVERRMLADGDMIGDHTWSHPDMAKLSATKQRAQLLSAERAIRDTTGGFTPCLWRPPYGATTPALTTLARSLGLLTIMWDVDPRDWALPGVGAIYSNVVANTHNGAIVIQHFGGGPRFETLSALPLEIDTLRAKGYRFVTVAQLLGLQLVYR